MLMKICSLIDMSMLQQIEIEEKSSIQLHMADLPEKLSLGSHLHFEDKQGTKRSSNKLKGYLRLSHFNIAGICVTFPVRPCFFHILSQQAIPSTLVTMQSAVCFKEKYVIKLISELNQHELIP